MTIERLALLCRKKTITHEWRHVSVLSQSLCLPVAESFCKCEFLGNKSCFCTCDSIAEWRNEIMSPVCNRPISHCLYGLDPGNMWLDFSTFSREVSISVCMWVDFYWQKASGKDVGWNFSWGCRGKQLIAISRCSEESGRGVQVQYLVTLLVKINEFSGPVMWVGVGSTAFAFGTP